MTINLTVLFIFAPLIAGILTLAMPKRFRMARDLIILASTAANLVFSVRLFGKVMGVVMPWAGFGMQFSLRAYHFSEFIVMASALFGFLIALYSTAFMRGKDIQKQFYSYFLISVAFINGAVLSDNIVLLLFFWEGLLLTMFGMIAIGKRYAFKTASKAFIIVGLADLFMLGGIGIAGHLSGSWEISSMSVPMSALGGAAFLLIMMGAVSKAGSMPFHSWIPDAAEDSPLPFMAFFPASLEKLLGIYFLARISLDIFKLRPDSWASVVLMVVGSVTILLAVMMALVQKEYKRLLSYHAISQVGYMILGIGTCLPVGIIGGLFHMLNNTLYKTCLFFTGGSVERQAGTTYLDKLGGLGRKMPITLTCFLISAAAISGVPPFNGFFSKELVYSAALERGAIFYTAAILGSFLTAASFLKLGHTVYFGKTADAGKNVKEAPWAMLVPMLTLAFLCVLFGIKHALPLDIFIKPVIAGIGEAGRSIAGGQPNAAMVLATVVVLFGAVINHIYGARITGSALKAADHIRYAPVLSYLYDRAEKKYFDPYEITMKVVNKISGITWIVDRNTDWIYNNGAVGVAYAFSRWIRREHRGYYVVYIAWSVFGSLAVILFAMFF